MRNKVFSKLVLVGFASVVGNLLAIERAGHAADAELTEFQVSAGQRQLFLDDHGIAEIKDLQRTMHQPTKRGAVIPGRRKPFRDLLATSGSRADHRQSGLA